MNESTTANDPDIEGLRRFSRHADRDLSPFFAGRREELADLAQRCEDTLHDWRERGRAGGRTVVIPGCPGMGKTSLIERFEADCNRADDPASPLAFRMSADDLTDSGALAAALAEAAFEETKVRNVLEATGADIARRLRAERTFAALKEAFFAGRSKARPVCLLIDEAQTVKPAQKEALRKLHGGHYGLPVLPVFAGLNGTEAALRNCGISRLSNKARMPLSALAVPEAAEAVSAMFRRYQVEGDTAGWIAAIAADSLGFPQHLHVGMAAAEEILAETGGVATAEGLERARGLAADARIAYYRDRLAPQVERNGAVLVELVHALDAKPVVTDLERWAGEFMEEEETRAFVSALIHDGVVQKRLGGRTGYEVPIPSMRRWLTEDFARELGAEDEPEPDGPSL